MGYSPSRVLDQAKLSRGSLARWKNGGEPLNEAKKRIADVFNITVPELMSGEIKKPATSEGDEQKRAEDEFLEVWRLVPNENKKILQDMIVADLKNKGLL